MVKITRKKLARGTKLQVDQMHGPASDTATQLSAGRITQDQLESGSSTFRLNLFVPYIGMQLFQPFNFNGNPATYNSTAVWDSAADLQALRTDPGSRPFGIPFVLPPTQNLFQSSGTSGAASFTLDETTPTAILDEISFSFDQRGEPAAIDDNFSNDFKSFPQYSDSAPARVTPGMWGSSRYQGSLNYRKIDSYNIKLAIMSKSQKYFGSNEKKMEREVWGAEIPFDAYSGDHLRLNPINISDISQAMHPYKSYMFLIYCDDLNHGEYIYWDNADNTLAPHGTWKPATAVDSQALVSVNVSLKFKQPLMDRDKHTGGSVVQNIPTVHNGVPTTFTLPITKPAAGDVISADNATSGFSTNMHKVDKVFRDKLNAGYDEDCMTAARQSLAQDSGYEIIAVPLMNNRRWGCVLSGTYARSEPYIDKDYSAADQIIADRRIIPLPYPVVIHHAFLAWNWMVPGVFGLTTFGASGTGTGRYSAGPQLIKPTSADFKVEVGVGLGALTRTDKQQAYDKVAYLSMRDPSSSGSGGTWFSKFIDYMKIHDFSLGDEAFGNTSENWDWEIHNIPLETAVGITGDGYFAQGAPYFAGTGNQITDARTAGASDTEADGLEQFIEVRMHITDSVKHTLTKNKSMPTDAYGWPQEWLLSGYQGHFVYLVCKKQLA